MLLWGVKTDLRSSACLCFSAFIIYVLFVILFGSRTTCNDQILEPMGNSLKSDTSSYRIFDTSHRRVVRGGLTVVTAYFNIGRFIKGTAPISYKHYARWMSVFGRINNPLVVFSDQEQVLDVFRQLRAKFPKHKTKFIKVSRSELWSFSLAKNISKIFKQPGYPVFHPNTVNENYSCVMHAKFELVNRVIREKLFRTKYITWLDIGLFRNIVGGKKVFKLGVPPGLKKRKIAYTEVSNKDNSLTVHDVIYRNLVWVCGAMFLGRAKDVYLYTEDYMSAVTKMMSENLMSTDQQVIYSMYLPKFNFKPRVKIQTFKKHGADPWFYLGYLSKSLGRLSV